MAHKIVVLKGSPRRNGNSAVLADQAIKGALENGAEVEEFLLDRMKIRPCNACEKCRDGEMECVIQDDMQKIYPKMSWADAYIIASPIYFFTMSAQLKACIDRWYGLLRKNEDVFKGKKIGILLSFGDTDINSSGAINAIHTFESTFNYLECEISGIVYGSADKAGEITAQKEVMDQAFELGRKLAAN